MTAKKSLSAMTLAAAAATIFATAPLSAMAAAHESSGGDAAKGKCIGGNSCKGKSSCSTASTSCAGQNACKGQGWIVTSKAECDEAGGTFEAS